MKDFDVARTPARDHAPTRSDSAGPPADSRHRGVIPRLNSVQTLVVCVAVAVLGIVTREPTRDVDESPTWTIVTGHPRGAQTMVFGPDELELGLTPLLRGERTAPILWLNLDSKP